MIQPVFFVHFLHPFTVLYTERMRELAHGCVIGIHAGGQRIPSPELCIEPVEFDVKTVDFTLNVELCYDN